MTQEQTVDSIITLAQGSSTDDTRLDRDYVAAVLHQLRAMAIQQYFVKYKRVNPLWVQTLSLEYDIALQDDVNSNCITKYLLPNYIQLDARMDGVTFIGNSENKSFKRIKTRGELATLKKHKLLNPDNGKYISALTDNGFVEFHSNGKIKKPIVAVILADPNDDPSYNLQVDQYPISQDLLPIMSDNAIKMYFNRIAAIPLDNRSNKNDLIQQPIK